MLKLYGVSRSNYYNKVKFVLLEKALPFEEVRMMPAHDEDTLARSAFGKIPCLETERGRLIESQVIVDYLEAAYPDKPLLPADPFAAARQRELIACLEQYLELVARKLYGQVFFGVKASESTRQRVQEMLPRHIESFKRLAQWLPYLNSETFGLADIVASIHFPLIAYATQAVYGSDFLLDAGIDWKAHAKLVGERSAAQKVKADREAELAMRKLQSG